MSLTKVVTERLTRDTRGASGKAESAKIRIAGHHSSKTRVFRKRWCVDKRDYHAFYGELHLVTISTWVNTTFLWCTTIASKLYGNKSKFFVYLYFFRQILRIFSIKFRLLPWFVFFNAYFTRARYFSMTRSFGQLCWFASLPTKVKLLNSKIKNLKFLFINFAFLKLQLKCLRRATTFSGGTSWYKYHCL